jgi:hypothetical protein
MWELRHWGKISSEHIGFPLLVVRQPLLLTITMG